MFRRIARLLLPISIALLPVFATGPLSAAPVPASGGVCTVGDHCAGNVTFQSKGNVFTIHDYSKDGHSVYGVIWTSSASGEDHVIYSHTNHRGYNASPVKKKLDIGNDVEIWYRVCLSEKGKRFHCSDARHDRA